MALSRHSEARRSSEDPVARSSRVDFSEGRSGDNVESSLGLEAPVLVESVGRHATTEGNELAFAHLLEDGLTRRTLIFTGESTHSQIVNKIDLNLPGDGIVDEGGLLGGSSEHVAHIFHWHDD